MPKSKQDEPDKSRHAAADEECCNDVLPVDCVFDGETEFPQSGVAES
ncbi:hypothetical protein VB713_27005 [Anabaena cylindrica UHCC 0172]|nr:hypothetical protein [Anabaena cylindrica]MEA5554582.1 hypothetical protein [Anabaena cylindrica UHCC 0172]